MLLNHIKQLAVIPTTPDEPVVILPSIPTSTNIITGSSHQVGAQVYDAAGNCYLALHEISTISNQENVVVKIDSEQNVVWSKKFGTTNSEVPRDIVIDTAGNIYLLLDQNSGNGYVRAEIIKLSNNGDFLASNTQVLEVVAGLVLLMQIIKSILLNKSNFTLYSTPILE